MHQNTFGGRALSGPAGGALELLRDLLLRKGRGGRKGEEGEERGREEKGREGGLPPC